MTSGTKMGDRGYTELLFGRRVRKDDPRVEACGTLDELNAFMGLAKASVRRKWVKALLHSCQRDLFIVASELAALPRDLRRLEFRVDEARVRRIEEEIETLEQKVKQEDGCFLIPGESKTSALLDVCRCVTRRAERQAVAIRRRMAVPQPVAAYLNRLSDLLYLLARCEEKTRARFVAGAASPRKSSRKR